MDQKMMLHFEVKKNDRTYVLEVPMGASYGEAYDATFELLQGILELSKQAADKAKAEQPEAPKE